MTYSVPPSSSWERNRRAAISAKVTPPRKKIRVTRFSPGWPKIWTFQNEESLSLFKKIIYFWLCSMWDHSFLTRDQTLAPSIGKHRVFTPGLPEKNYLLLMLLFPPLKKTASFLRKVIYVLVQMVHMKLRNHDFDLSVFSNFGDPQLRGWNLLILRE